MSRFGIISGSDIYAFDFFADGVICKAAIIQNSIYKLVAQYPAEEQAKACALACSIEDQGYHSVVSSESDGSRHVWTEIRSLIQPIPMIRLDAYPLVQNQSA